MTIHYTCILQHIMASVECNVLFCALSSLFVYYYISRWSHFHKTFQSCQSLDNILVYYILIAGRYAIIFLRPDDCDYKPKNTVTIIFIYFRVTLYSRCRESFGGKLQSEIYSTNSNIFLYILKEIQRETHVKKNNLM